jgi:hypothetical protein
MFQTIQTNFGYQSLAQAAEIQLGKNKNYSFGNIIPVYLYIKNTARRFMAVKRSRSLNSTPLT